MILNCIEIIKDLLGYEIDFQVVTPDSNQSRDASSEVSLLTDENLTSQPLENSATSSNEVSDGILSPLKMSNLSEDMSMEKDSEDDVSTPQKKSAMVLRHHYWGCAKLLLMIVMIRVLKA